MLPGTCRACHRCQHDKCGTVSASSAKDWRAQRPLNPTHWQNLIGIDGFISHLYCFADDCAIIVVKVSLVAPSTLISLPSLLRISTSHPRSLKRAVTTKSLKSAISQFLSISPQNEHPDSAAVLKSKALLCLFFTPSATNSAADCVKTTPTPSTNFRLSTTCGISNFSILQNRANRTPAHRSTTRLTARRNPKSVTHALSSLRDLSFQNP